MNDHLAYHCANCCDLYVDCDCNDPRKVTYDELLAAYPDWEPPSPAPAAVEPTTTPEPFTFTPVPAMPPVTVADLLKRAANDPNVDDDTFAVLSRAFRGDNPIDESNPEPVDEGSDLSEGKARTCRRCRRPGDLHCPGCGTCDPDFTCPPTCDADPQEVAAAADAVEQWEQAQAQKAKTA